MSNSALVPMAVKLEFAGYRLQTVLSAYTQASIDHVRLTLSSDNSGAFVATAAVKRIAPTALASPVGLGNLRMGTSYRLQADAYAAASESAATLISDPLRSVAVFSTPVLSKGSGIDSIDDSRQRLVSLPLQLADRTYAGHGTLGVALSAALSKTVKDLTISLYTGTKLTFQKSFPVATVTGLHTVPIGNLRLGTTYALLADGYDANKAKLSSPLTSFTILKTPAIANNQIDDSLGLISVPCN